MTREDVDLAKQEYEIAKMKYDDTKRKFKKETRTWGKIIDKICSFLWVTYCISTMLIFSFMFILNGIGIAIKTWWLFHLGVFGLSCVIYALMVMIINAIKEDKKTNN